jgi:enoyl-CoA hydratase / 3-hydroxyacyl-CoA dehydrogenase
MAMQNFLNNSHVAIIGAGTMGCGIAQVYATHGFFVTIVDQSDDALKKSQNSITTDLNKGVLRNIFTDEEAQSILSRLVFSTKINDCSNASLVVEAIFEDLLAKRKLFSHLENILNQKAILATNTSSLKVLDLQKTLKTPERVLGLHYFFPPTRNRLVEIIDTKLTDKNSFEQAEIWQRKIQKTIIKSKDSPGFVVNRFFVPWLNEAMRIVHEQLGNIATVEAALKNFFQINMGPFELMNITGLPITLHCCNALAKAFGEFYAPCPIIIPQIETHKSWNLYGQVDSARLDDIAMRVLSVVGVISCQMVFEEQVCTVTDTDLGARVGLAWPKGPFQLLQENLEKVSITVTRLKKENPAFYQQFQRIFPMIETGNIRLI